MCYSAQVVADYKRYVQLFGAAVDIKAFYETFWRRNQDAKLRIPKAMEDTFLDAQSGTEREIRELIEAWRTEQAAQFEQELFKQKKRLADAERTLLTKTTKAATESRRIATDKMAWAMGKLADLRRSEPLERDRRIFPGWYAPVMVWEDGRRVVKPMRYQCRPAGKPAFYDVKFPGTYNARRDNLEGFWRPQFGRTHGVMVVNAFYENVARHSAEHRELAPGEQPENLVLEFKPRPTQDMLVACLWSRWTAPGEPDLLSFAAITDEPPDEVAVAGHDRCIVPIKAEHVDAWLNPDPRDLGALYAILDDRQRPYYEHRLAA
jgi:putative SOS response-associated peptidase YedK